MLRHEIRNGNFENFSVENQHFFSLLTKSFSMFLPSFHTKPQCAHGDYTTIPNSGQIIPNHSVHYEDHTTIPKYAPLEGE